MLPLNWRWQGNNKEKKGNKKEETEEEVVEGLDQDTQKALNDINDAHSFAY